MNQTFTDPKDGTKTIRYRCFDPEGVAKVKPVRAVESLINQTKPYDPVMSKTTGGFGLKKTVFTTATQDDKKGGSSHLLEKIRRNQHNLALASNQNAKQQQESGPNEDYMDNIPLMPGTPAGGVRRAASTSMSVDPKLLFKQSVRNQASSRPGSTNLPSRVVL